MTLAETISLLEPRLAADSPFSDVAVARHDLRTLLSAARRVQAMDSADGQLAQIRSHIKRFGKENAAVVYSHLLPMTKDLASSALTHQAEVERLTAANETLRISVSNLERLRGYETERADTAEARLESQTNDAGTFLARLTTAEARVRALEQENERLRNELRYANQLARSEGRDTR